MPITRCLLFCFCIMDKYTYEGPVKEVDRIVTPMWAGTTYAESEKKARSNLTYQYKKSHNKVAATKITLTGKIILAE